MDKNLLQKYFRNRCTLEEVEQVLNWFQTPEGEAYLTETLDKDMQRFSDEENMLLSGDVPTKKMLQRLKLTRRAPHRLNNRGSGFIRVAVILLICSLVAGSYWFTKHTGTADEPEEVIAYRTISTLNDQHRLVSLSDGTQIRLNANSSIELPEIFSPDERVVKLTGEAWFDVAPDETRPFHIMADRARIQVLGTEFNIKVDTHQKNVQVAVAEGRVSLYKGEESNGREAILTQNTFAIYHLDNDEILIENTPVANYLSWFSGRLYFYNDPLWAVNRYLERIYDVEFMYEEEPLKELSLSIDLSKDELHNVLDIIAQTLGIDYQYENRTVLWTKNS